MITCHGCVISFVFRHVFIHDAFRNVGLSHILYINTHWSSPSVIYRMLLLDNIYTKEKKRYYACTIWPLCLYLFLLWILISSNYHSYQVNGFSAVMPGPLGLQNGCVADKLLATSGFITIFWLFPLTDHCRCLDVSRLWFTSYRLFITLRWRPVYWKYWCVWR